MKFARSILLMFLIGVLIACAKPQEKARNELKKMNIDYTENSFFESIGRGNKEVVDLFLTAGMNPNIKVSQTAMTPLMLATVKGHEEVVNLLLTKGADINAKEKSGNTALMGAVLNNHLNIAKYLIKNGADVNARNDKGLTALFGAAKAGKIEFAKMLLDNKADPNIADTAGEMAGCTPLLIAVSEGHLDVVKVLIEKGANINAQMANNTTALSLAVMLAHADIEQLLLSSGAKELEPAVLKEVESNMFLVAKGSYDDYKAGISKDTPAHLLTAKRVIDALLTRFPNSSFKAQATNLSESLNGALAIIDKVEKAASEIQSAVSGKEFEKASATLRSIKQYIPQETYSALAKKIDEEQNKPVNVTVLELLSDKSNYVYKKVIVKGYMCMNWSGMASFDLVDDERKCKPSVSVSYGNLPTNKKRSLLTSDPVPERSHISVEVIGVFDGDDRITAIDVSL